MKMRIIRASCLYISVSISLSFSGQRCEYVVQARVAPYNKPFIVKLHTSVTTVK